MRASTFYKKMGSFGKGVVDKVSAVMAAPAIIKGKISQTKSGINADVLRQANAYKGAPDRDASGNMSDAFKVRSVAEGVKAKMTKKK